VLDLSIAPLKRLVLEATLFNEDIALVVSSQAVDSNTVVSMDNWHKPTTFPPMASVFHYVSHNTPTTPPAPLNVPVNPLQCDDLFLHCCPAPLTTVQFVDVSHLETLQSQACGSHALALLTQVAPIALYGS